MLLTSKNLALQQSKNNVYHCYLLCTADIIKTKPTHVECVDFERQKTSINSLLSTLHVLTFCDIFVDFYDIFAKSNTFFERHVIFIKITYYCLKQLIIKGGVMSNDSKRKKNIALAFFDILGTSETIERGHYNKVYNFYSYMVKLCSEEMIPLSFSNLPGRRLFSENCEIVIKCPMHHAFFSDTFILWIEYEPFFEMSLRGFYEKCMDIFTEAIKNGIPLRGAISRGLAIMDCDNNIYLGKPLVEAAKAEHAQNWLGIALTKSCQEATLSEVWALLPYEEHIKKEKIYDCKKALFTNCVLDWPKYWRNTQEDDDIIKYINKMNRIKKYSSYYENTIEFIKYSYKNNDFWDDKLPPPPKLKPFIVRYIDD